MVGGLLIPLIGLGFQEKSNVFSNLLMDKISVFAGILFFVFGIAGFAGQNVTNWIGGDKLDMIISGWIIFRHTFLLTGVVSFALFIALISWMGRSDHLLPVWFNYFGLFLSMILFISLPVPFILFIWCLLLGIIILRSFNNKILNSNVK